MIKEKLCLNDYKTKFIIIGRQQLTKGNIASLCLGDANIALVTLIKNLGSWFDENMTIVTHINKLCKAACFYLQNIRRMRKYLTSEASQSCLFMPLLWVAQTTAAIVCFSILLQHILQRFRAYRIVRPEQSACRPPKFDHITPTLIRLHQLLVCFKIEYKILILSFKAIYGVVPFYI